MALINPNINRKIPIFSELIRRNNLVMKRTPLIICYFKDEAVLVICQTSGAY